MNRFASSHFRRRLGAALFVLIALAAVRTVAAADVASPVPVAKPVPARPAAPSGPAAFDTFRIISERNIFDPNRVGRVARGSEVVVPRGDIITLVGTMHYEKGLFAFFDGSSAAFQQSLKEGQMIAQYTVTHIRNDGVDLTRDGHPLALAIGQQLRRPVGGDWAVVASDTVRREAEAASAAAAAASSPAAPVIPAGASDTLKRLMEQRQKELKQ